MTGRISRRSYVKYAACGTVAATVVGGGYYYYGYRPKPTVTPTITPAPTTPISTPTSTPTPTVELASLHGRLFFDYNGNGVQDSEEPAVINAKVQLKDNTGKVVGEAVTDSSGDYKLEDVPTGSYSLYVEADKKFRYMCRSREEFVPMTKGYDVSLGELMKMDVGLMEGFLTLPMSSKTNYSIGRFYDWDSRNDYVKWWDGKTFPYHNVQGKPWDDDHTGTDFDTNEGEPILATAPGVVIDLIKKPNGELELDIAHPFGFSTAYFHFSRTLVKVGERVSRGQKIAEVGETGTFFPHLHLDFYMPSGLKILDPYRPVFEIDSTLSGYWTVDENRKKYWVSVPVEWNQNLENYWTEDNYPKHPD